jgi:hypothetical protein
MSNAEDDLCEDAIAQLQPDATTTVGLPVTVGAPAENGERQPAEADIEPDSLDEVRHEVSELRNSRDDGQTDRRDSDD